MWEGGPALPTTVPRRVRRGRAVRGGQSMRSMQNITVIKHGIIFILAVLLLGGCASTGALHTITPPTVKLANYKTILVSVSSQVPEATQEVIQLESMIITKLLEKGLFEKVVAGSASPDASTNLRLNAKIVELKKVGARLRAIFGAFAGRAGIVVNVKLIELETGNTIGAFKSEGKSSGGTVFAGTTPQAIQRAVEQIIAFVQKSM